MRQTETARHRVEQREEDAFLLVLLVPVSLTPYTPRPSCSHAQVDIGVYGAPAPLSKARSLLQMPSVLDRARLEKVPRLLVLF